MNSGVDYGFGNDCVGIDEDEHVAIRFPRAGVACCSNLSMRHLDYAGAVLSSDRARTVRGGIVNDHDLIGKGKRPCGVGERIQCLAE